MQGFLLVDKPRGWTSFDVVAKVRSILAKQCSLKTKNIKVGHTGTLDPMATGLLVLCVGKKYTKMAGEITGQDKEYVFTARLGASSTTGDADGEIREEPSPGRPTKADLEQALSKFVGEIEQTPSAYSAIKINGQRAYKLARAGQEVEMPTRRVKVIELELTDYNYPNFSARAVVSKGTYIRTLAEDIAKSLDTNAYLTDLRRTRVGDWSISQAINPENLDFELIDDSLQQVN